MNRTPEEIDAVWDHIVDVIIAARRKSVPVIISAEDGLVAILRPPLYHVETFPRLRH